MEKVRVLTYYDGDKENVHRLVYRFKNRRLIIERTEDEGIYYVILKRLIKPTVTFTMPTGIAIIKMGCIIWVNRLKLTEEAIKAMYDATRIIAKRESDEI